MSDIPESVEVPVIPIESNEDNELLIQKCKRDLCCGNYTEAVTAMENVCKTMSEKLGQMAYPMAEAYYVYGSALLELSRVESNILGNALDGVPAEEEGEDEPEENGKYIEDEVEQTSEEKEDISEKIIDAMCEDRSQAISETPNANETNEVETVVSIERDGKDNSAAGEEKPDEAPTNGVETSDVVTDTPSVPEDNVVLEEKNSDKAAEDENNKEDAELAVLEEKNSDEAAEDENNKEDAELAVLKDNNSDEAAEDENDKEDAELSADETESHEEEDISNLQLAWETLELSRLINERHFNELPEGAKNDEFQTTLLSWADSVQLLSEVGMELGRWDQAYDDCQKALSLRKQAFTYATSESDTISKRVKQSRLLGESHYQLSSVCAGKGDYDLAVGEIEQCMEILNSCLRMIESHLQDEVENSSDQKEYFEKQKREINSILPDLSERVRELKSEKVDLDNMREEMKIALSSIAAAALPQEQQPATDDISHLIRKKRPAQVLGNGDSNSLTEQNGTKDVNGDYITSENGQNGESAEVIVPPTKKARVEETGLVAETE